jgi:hypothetical protein
MKTQTQPSQTEKNVNVTTTIFTVAMVIGFVLFVYKAVVILQANGILPR